MTDDEKAQVQAQLVLEMLAGLYRCARCGKLGKLLVNGEVGDGPLICASCYRYTRVGWRL